MMPRFFSKNIETSVGKDALKIAWVILNDTMINNTKLNNQEYNLLGNLCRHVKAYGDFVLQQQFCYILYFARATSAGTDNYKFCIALENYFRGLCEPSFDSENSFTHINLEFLNELDSTDKPTISMQA